MAPKPEARDQPVNVRFPRELHEALIARAEADERSMAATIRVAVRLYLATPSPSEPS